MADWDRQALKLKEGHGWKAKPGYKIFVADHGAIRFDLPKEWVVVPGPKSIRFYDRQPPDDNCRLEVSLIRHPPIDWSGLPLPKLIREVVKDGPKDAPNIGDAHTLGRPNLELVWTELSFIDASERRDARAPVFAWHARPTRMPSSLSISGRTTEAASDRCGRRCYPRSSWVFRSRTRRGVLFPCSPEP